MHDAITHDTLAQEWRRRMVARSTIGALLLTVPLLSAAAIGFSAGPGGLPFGISAITSGPSAPATSGDGEGAGNPVTQLIGDASTTPVAAPFSGGGGAGEAGSGDAPGAGTTGGNTGGGAPVNSTGTPTAPSGGGGSAPNGGGGTGTLPSPPSNPAVPNLPSVPNVPSLPGIGGGGGVLPGAGGASNSQGGLLGGAGQGVGALLGN